MNGKTTYFLPILLQSVFTKNTDIKSTKNMKQSVKIVSYIYDNYVQ